MRVLALELRSRQLGWCSALEDRLVYGGIEMPGILSLGRLGRHAMDDIAVMVLRFEPVVIAYCKEDFDEFSHVTDALSAMRHAVEVAAADAGIPTRMEEKRTVRKAILGTGDFGDHPIVAESGRKAAREAVMLWAQDAGYRPRSVEVANAIVLHAYVTQ